MINEIKRDGQDIATLNLTALIEAIDRYCDERKSGSKEDFEEARGDLIQLAWDLHREGPATRLPFWLEGIQFAATRREYLELAWFVETVADIKEEISL